MEADKRFSHIAKDPKFRRIPKGEKKVKIDKRFRSMFKDKRFEVKYTVDKRGRPVSHSTSEDLKRYYHIDSDEEDEEKTEEIDCKLQCKQQISSKTDDVGEQREKGMQDEIQENESKSNHNLVVVSDIDKMVTTKATKKLKNLMIDYARGEGSLFSSESSSDGEESDEQTEHFKDDSIEHKWGELDADAETTEEATYRFAACNMDWDKIRATDLMVLFNSFLSPGGSISSVVIYPSEFGKKRLAEEEINGPAELIQQSNIDEQEEGEKYHMEKLRQYQLNRLKYYYAVVTCDSVESANRIYTECDGMEYESSATKVDLRFIPDDMEFDDEAKEVCCKLPEFANYKPRFFTTTALQQAKVDLTWDETNPNRVEIAERMARGKVDNIADSDLQAYLASSSGEESEDDEAIVIPSNHDAMESSGKKNMIDKYKLLLQEIEEKEKTKERKEIGMEITWGIDLQNRTNKVIKDKQAARENITPFQQFLDKCKEKRKKKREAKKNSKTGGDLSCDIPSDVDMNDPYFAEEFNTPEFREKERKDLGSDSNFESDAESTDQKAQLDLLLDVENHERKHFSLKKIQAEENQSKSQKRNKKKQALVEDISGGGDDFHINVNDERFSALYTSHHFNIDPSNPHYKKTKNMEKLIGEKIRRRTDVEDTESSLPEKKLKQSQISENKEKSHSELHALVKSIKCKASGFKSTVK